MTTRKSRDDEERPAAPITRRGFLAGAASAALVAGVGTQASAARAGSSRVVLIRHDGALDDKGQARPAVITEMLDRGVTALTGARSVQAAWKRLLRPNDLLGIKSNVWDSLPTPAAVEDALRLRAREVGIPPAMILLDDRGARKRLAACTALINARPLRTHHWAGVGGCLKNYIMFVERPAAYHPDSCADLGAIWKLPIVANKTRLNVLVMLTPLYHGRGPHHFSPRYVWPYRGLILSADPVAADAVGLAILQARRREAFGRERPLDVAAKHIELADKRHGVGVADLKRIKLIKIGPKKGMLI